jgi:hypothetical protein
VGDGIQQRGECLGAHPVSPLPPIVALWRLGPAARRRRSPAPQSRWPTAARRSSSPLVVPAQTRPATVATEWSGPKAWASRARDALVEQHPHAGC